MTQIMTKDRILIGIQFFAEGGGADGGTAGVGDGTTGVTSGVPDLKGKGVKSNPLADVKYGIQDDVQTADAQETHVATDRVAEFEKLIKGEYKDLYDQRMQDTIQKRLKSSKETEAKYNALTPTIELLASKYGVDASDIEALNKAISDDDAYYEDEALEKGITVQQLKEIKRMERENADLKRQMQEASIKENADRIFAGWMEQSEALKQVYPQFDLDAEMGNQRFVDLLRNNIDVRTAYEVIHKDDIIPAAMQFTAQQVQQKLTKSIMANGSRPVENGVNGQAGALVKSDVSQLSKADRQEIIRRVQRGERIRF